MGAFLQDFGRGLNMFFIRFWRVLWEDFRGVLEGLCMYACSCYWIVYACMHCVCMQLLLDLSTTPPGSIYFKQGDWKVQKKKQVLEGFF